MINTNEERKLSPFSIGEDNKKIKQWKGKKIQERNYEWSSLEEGCGLMSLRGRVFTGGRGGADMRLRWIGWSGESILRFCSFLPSKILMEHWWWKWPQKPSGKTWECWVTK
jgi:hypothetical protein